jgi:TetR/AcrR family transcriptional regulator, mexCD-oprJ operon repressor
MFSTTGRTQRVDAHRNRDAIIEATLTTLSERPGASVGDIAVAAGVSRGTLYGHFTSRRALVLAAFRWMMSEADSHFSAIDPDLATPESVNELIATSWWVLGHLSGMTSAARTELTASELRRLHEEPLARIRLLIARGRAEGVFRSDQSLGWQTECFYAILQTGAAQIRDGQLLEPQAAAEMVTTIRALLARENAESVEAAH